MKKPLICGLAIAVMLKSTISAFKTQMRLIISENYHAPQTALCFCDQQFLKCDELLKTACSFQRKESPF
jgi:hypothetical protein